MIGYLRGVGEVLFRRGLVEAGQSQQRCRAGQVGIGCISQLLDGSAGLAQFVGLAGEPCLDRAGRGLEQAAAEPLLLQSRRGRECRIDVRLLAVLEGVGGSATLRVRLFVAIGRLALPAFGHAAPRGAGVR